MHDCAAHEHRAFECVIRLVVYAPCQRSEQVIIRSDGRFACIHQQEASGAIGIFHHARAEAALTEQRGRLVAHHCGDRYFRAQHVLAQVADHCGRITHLGHYCGGNIQCAQQHFIPLLRMDIEQHCTSGVSRVSHMHLTAGEVPHEEGIDRTEAEFAAAGAFKCAGHVFQYPLHLCTREIRVGYKSRLIAYGITEAVEFKALDQMRCTAALPHDSVIHGLPRLTIPHQRSLALISNPDCGYLACGDAAFLHGHFKRLNLAIQNIRRVMFHPSRIWINLLKLNPMRRNRLPQFVKHHCPRTRCPLVQRHHVLHAVPLLLLSAFINVNIIMPLFDWFGKRGKRVLSLSVERNEQRKANWAIFQMRISISFTFKKAAHRFNQSKSFS